MTGPGKAKPAGADGSGTCTITATGALTGYCGLSSGMGTGTIVTITPVPGTSPKNTVFTFKFWSAGGTLVIDGTYSSPGKSGQIKAVAEAIPNITVAGTACTNKTATQFAIAGEANFLQDNTPV